MATVTDIERPRPNPRPAVAPEDRAVHLFGLLRGASRLHLFAAGARWLCLAAAALLAAALVAVFADAVLGLPAAIRRLIDLLFVAAAVAVVAALTVQTLRNRFDPRRAARLVECRLDIPDSSLINAVEFAATTPRSDSPTLRDRTVRIAEEKSRDVSALDVVSLRPLGRAAAIVGGAVVVALAAWLVAPRLFAMVVPRYLDAAGDHPPYTLVTFDVAIAPQPVYHGKPARITATLGGPEAVDQAAFVFLDDAGAPTDPLPMLRTEEATYALELQRADSSRRFYIDTPAGRSETFSLDVLEVPFLEEVAVRYEYPPYTGWPAQEQTLDHRGLRALAGTEVIVTARSNLPLRGGKLTLDAAPAQPASRRAASTTIQLLPVAGDPHIVSGRARLIHTSGFSLSLTATNGADSLEPLTGPVAVSPDRPPRIAIVQPQPHVIVVENWQVPVQIEAVDDVRVAGIKLNRSVNGWGPSPVDLPLTELRPGVVRAESEFDLAALGARAGDVITYYATAVDNHPDPPHFTDTETYVIQVISEEEYIQFARQQYQVDELVAEFEAIREDLDRLQQERDKRLAELESLEQQLEQNPDDPELQQKLQQAEESLRKYAEQAESLAKELQERTEQLRLYDLEEPYQDLLERLQKLVEQQSQTADEAAQSLQKLREEGLTPENKQAFQQALDKLQQQSEPFGDETQQSLDEAAQDLELFQLADNLLSQAERLKSVIQQQRDLATRLAELKDRPSLTPDEQHRADQLAKEQELLEQELQDVAQQLREAAAAGQERLPKMSQSAQQIADAIEQQQIPQDQQQAATKAREGSGSEAHQRADSAATKLESLAGQCPDCQGAAGEMGQGLDGPLSLSKESLRRTLEQLAQGRSIPGRAPPGEGQGQGQGSRPGSGSAGSTGSAGNPAGGQGQAPPHWRPGQTFPGSQSRTPIMGPRMLVEQPPPREGGRLGGNDRGDFLPGDHADPAAGAELLTPESREFRPSSAGTLRGVPVPYRKDAEAYFRRLAEDEAM